MYTEKNLNNARLSESMKKVDIVVIKASLQQEKKSGPAERKTLGNNEY